MRELKRQLKMMKQIKNGINPDSFWMQKNKEDLLNRIANTNVGNEKKIEVYGKNLSLIMKFERNIEAFIPHNFKNGFKPALIVFLALFFTSGGWIASAYAEPGDMLWSTKVALNNVVEKSQIALANEDDEAELHLKFATKKADVIKQVSEKTEVEKEDKAKIIKDTKDKMKENLNSANESLKKISPEKAGEMVKEVSLKTTEITNSVKASAEKIAESDIDLAKDLDETANETQKTSLEMVEVVLQKKVDANNEITEEEKNIVSEHIANIVTNLETHIDSLKTEKEKQETELNNINQSTSTLNINSNIGNSLNNSVTTGTINISANNNIVTGTLNLNANSTTINLTTSTILNAEKIIEVKNILDQTRQELEKGKDEATNLIQDDVLGAIQKTKQITNVAKEAEIKIDIIVKNTATETVQTNIVSSTEAIKTEEIKN
ncbi:MAG: hypothetical protein WC414_03435 [Patescibacteria group bacterium]